MPSATGLLALPYPLPADALTDYPAVAQALAELLEDKIGCVEISDTLLGADAASVTIAVPNTFDHLLLLTTARSAIASTFDRLSLRPNNQSGAGTYNYGAISGTNTAAAVHTAAAPTSGECGYIPGNSQGGFGDSVIRFTNYRAARYRRWDYFAAGWTDANGGDQQVVRIGGGIHKSAGSNVADWLTSLVLFADGGNLRAGSRFSLYGLRGPQ